MSEGDIEDTAANDSEMDQGSSSPDGAPDQSRVQGGTEAGQRWKIFGYCWNPGNRPTGGMFAAHPAMQKLVAKLPEFLPRVTLISEFERAQAEAEADFRQRELSEDWAAWRGTFPWEGDRDPDTTDCPWWRAGAEYVFHLAAAWRDHYPEPEKVDRLLGKQIAQNAHWVYWKRVYVHDAVNGNSSKAEHLLLGHADRFFNIAYLFAHRKFLERDRDEWRGRAVKLAGGTTRSRSSAKSDKQKAAARKAYMAPHIAPTARKPTLSRMASNIGVEQSSLSRWRNGIQKLSAENVGKLAEHLKVKPGEIPN